MKYSIFIDQVKSLEWGLNINQASLFSILYNISNWAKYYIIDATTGFVYYHASRNMIINEIPLCYNKPDTVYRAYIFLFEKGIIDYKKDGNKDLIRVTEQGKSWNNVNLGNKSDNSEINPTKLGNKSENNSEINPTDHNTILDHNTIDHNLSWKNDFSIYLKQLQQEYSKMIKDDDFIKQQEIFYPNIDIKNSLKKAYINFWGTEAGWNYKKKKRIKIIDWKSTLTNAINLNKVYRQKEDTKTNQTSIKYKNLENYKPGRDVKK